MKKTYLLIAVLAFSHFIIAQTDLSSNNNNVSTNGGGNEYNMADNFDKKNIFSFGIGTLNGVSTLKNGARIPFDAGLYEMAILSNYKLLKDEVVSPMLRITWARVTYFSSTVSGFGFSPMNVGLGLNIQVNPKVNIQPSINAGYVFAFAGGEVESGVEWYPELKVNFGKTSLGLIYASGGQEVNEGSVERINQTVVLFNIGVLF